MTARDLVPSAGANPVARRESVDQVHTAEQLRQRGKLRGISGSTLASELLVTIARDGLYNAVLDES
jgi:hypothetical protein